MRMQQHLHYTSCFSYTLFRQFLLKGKLLLSDYQSIMELLSSSLPAAATALLPVFLLLFNNNFADAIKCYQCLERPQSHERHLSCSYFDKSKKFHAECEHSTFCLKRASYLQLNNGSVISISVHTCADQAQKTVIEDETGAFNWGKIVHKFIYNDGCYSHPAPFMLTTETTHCFCSTDFCNGSQALRLPSLTSLMIAAAALILRGFT